MISRLVILHSILAGGLLTTYLLGYLPFFLEADRLYAIPIIGAFTLLGILLMGLNRITASLWLAERLPGVGLALTVIGLVWASNGDLGGDGFKRDILHALIGNLSGVVGWLWLELNIKVCGK